MLNRALKFGRKAPKNHVAIDFKRIWTGVTPPPHPAMVDYLANLSNWQMLGNNTYGDCVAVTWANMRRLVTATLSKETYPTLRQVLQFYATQNPNGQDNGMDMQTAWEELNKNGGPDGVKAVAFAKIDYTDLEQVKAATAIFGYVLPGINVQSANMDEFDQGVPWDYVRGSPIEGGHSVLEGGYLGKPNDDTTFITWAEETAFTDNFYAHNVEELWVVIWPEHLGTLQFMQGIDLAVLAADYKMLTGNQLPIPGPTPTPTPVGPGCIPYLLSKYFKPMAVDPNLKDYKKLVTGLKALIKALGG